MKKNKKRLKARDWNMLKIIQGLTIGRHKVFKDKSKYTRKNKHKGRPNG